MWETGGLVGGVALVLVLGIQIGALPALLDESWGPAIAAALICTSRAVATIGCTRGVRGARKDGLGVTYTETIHPVVTAIIWTVLTIALCLGAWVLDLPWWRGLIIAAAALLATGWLLRR
ncbi:hypothetical protein BHE97_19365 [Aeromicrobium sp. PE09-221]|nr:hypothetical protein BHE97_19365 [Aeromicrobium sp. PE09-221]